MALCPQVRFTNVTLSVLYAHISHARRYTAPRRPSCHCFASILLPGNVGQGTTFLLIALAPCLLVHTMTGSGLSSSAAIVVSSSLAVLAARGVELTKGDVAEFTCTAERHVGVTSGGMDQAISVMGMPGVAMLVEFNPVRACNCLVCASTTCRRHMMLLQ